MRAAVLPQRPAAEPRTARMPPFTQHAALQDDVSYIDEHSGLPYREDTSRKDGTSMRPVALMGALLVSCAGRRTFDRQLSYSPPREGLRPGTAAGEPQTPF
ncbi:hypothetical protein GCM10018966_001380 [Streptomyces yanii]